MFHLPKDKDDCERKRALCHFISTLLSLLLISLSFSHCCSSFTSAFSPNFTRVLNFPKSWPASPTPPSLSLFLSPVSQSRRWAPLSSNTTSPLTARPHSARAMSRSYTWPKCAHEGLRISNKHAGVATLSPAVSFSFGHFVTDDRLANRRSDVRHPSYYHRPHIQTEDTTNTTSS